MALASYGKPVFLDEFRSMIHVGDNGQYTIDELRLEERFGKRRKKDDPFLQHHFDIACSLQHVLEETVLQLVNWLQKETGELNLCLAGGWRPRGVEHRGRVDLPVRRRTHQPPARFGGAQ